MATDNKAGWGGGLTGLQALLVHAVLGWDGLFTDNISFQQKCSILETPRRGMSCSETDHLGLPHCLLYPSICTFCLCSICGHRDCHSQLSYSWPWAYWTMLSWRLSSFLNCFRWITQFFSSVWEACTALSLFSLPAESEMSWVFFWQAAITYTWLLCMLWLLHLMAVLNDVTLMVQRDGVQKPHVF